MKLGDHVMTGQPIGTAGVTSGTTDIHFHERLSWNELKLDSMLATGMIPVR